MTQEPVRFKYRSLPAEPPPSAGGPNLDLKVIFTDLPKTTAALTTARTMARGLGARITLMMAQVIPYPLPLSAPDIPIEFTERVLESIAVDDTAVELLLCRDRCETIRHALPQDSVVIVGTRKWRWWPCWERRLARILRSDGRRVLVIAL